MSGDPMCPDCEMIMPCRCMGDARAAFQRELDRVRRVPLRTAFEPIKPFVPEKDPIEPEHYVELDPEPIDVIESWGLDFHESQVIKYIARAGRKGGEGKRLEDLLKARWYMDRRIEQLKKRKNGE